MFNISPVTLYSWVWNAFYSHPIEITNKESQDLRSSIVTVSKSQKWTSYFTRARLWAMYPVRSLMEQRSQSKLDIARNAAFGFVIILQ